MREMCAEAATVENLSSWLPRRGHTQLEEMEELGQRLQLILCGLLLCLVIIIGISLSWGLGIIFLLFFVSILQKEDNTYSSFNTQV